MKKIDWKKHILENSTKIRVADEIQVLFEGNIFQKIQQKFELPTKYKYKDSFNTILRKFYMVESTCVLTSAGSQRNTIVMDPIIYAENNLLNSILRIKYSRINQFTYTNSENLTLPLFTALDLVKDASIIEGEWKWSVLHYIMIDILVIAMYTLWRYFWFSQTASDEYSKTRSFRSLRNTIIRSLKVVLINLQISVGILALFPN